MNAGSYTATVTVSDAAGNVDVQRIAVGISAQQATLTKATLSGKWKQSRITGTLAVAGTVPRAGTYAIVARRGKATGVKASFTLPAARSRRRSSSRASSCPARTRLRSSRRSRRRR